VRPALAASDVQTFLRGRFGDDVTSVAELPQQGVWSNVYEFHRGRDHYIARFSAHSEDFQKDRIAARHSSPDLPIPPIVEIGEAFGGSFAISERATGEFLDSLDGQRMRRVLPSLFAALDAMRVADISSATGYGVWRGDGTAPHATWREALLDVARDRPSRTSSSWRSALESSPTGTGPFDEAFGRMRQLVDRCPEQRYLVHSDLPHHNVFVQDDRLTAVIDWGSSLYGDFLYEVAWLSFWWPWYPAWADIDIAREAAYHYESIGLAVPAYAERIRCYEIEIGLSGQAWYAPRGEWANLETAARRTLELARAS